MTFPAPSPGGGPPIPEPFPMYRKLILAAFALLVATGAAAQAKKRIDEILLQTVVDPVGPEFMAPPSRDDSALAA